MANHRHDNSITKHGQTKQKGKQNEDDDRSATTNETSFVQSGGIMCYCCGKKGCKSPPCPERDIMPKDQWAIRKAEQHLQAETNNNDDEIVGPHKTNGTIRNPQRAGWSGVQVNLMNHNHQPSMRETITLDNGSTLSLFCNPELVENIRESKTILKMHANAGSKLSNQQATVPEFGTVWFQEDAIANIFGFGDLVDQYWITYDSAKEDAFLVHIVEKPLLTIGLISSCLRSVCSCALS